MGVNVPGLISIIIFYLLILAVGIYAAVLRKRRKGKDKEGERMGESEDVMLAGRSIGYFVGTFTMTATWVGGGYINGTAESVYTSGLVWAQGPWGYAISLILGGLLFAKGMREQGYITMLDPLQDKYGTWMGGLLYIPALLGETFWSAAILSALGATLSVILDLDINIAVIISACIAVVYTFFGGLYSVAYTDVIQLICIFVGLWLTIPFALTHDHSKNISDTKDEWLGSLKKADSGLWIDYAMVLMFGGIPWQVYFQRVLSSKSPKSAQILSFSAAIGCFIMAVPAVLIGAIAKSADWTQLPTSSSQVQNGKISDSRLVLPLVLQYLTPTWVSFFGLGAISAAVMSSADSSVLSASSMFAHNIYKLIFRPKATEREIVWVMRFGIFAVGAAATAMALTIKSIYTLWFLCSDLVFCIIFPQLLCAVYVPFVNTYGSLSAYIVGLVLRLGGGEPLVSLEEFIPYPTFKINGATMVFPFRSFAALCSLITLLVVSYLTSKMFHSRCLPEELDIFRTLDREAAQQERKQRRRKERDEKMGLENNPNELDRNIKLTTYKSSPLIS